MNLVQFKIKINYFSNKNAKRDFVFNKNTFLKKYSTDTLTPVSEKMEFILFHLEWKGIFYDVCYLPWFNEKINNVKNFFWTNVMSVFLPLVTDDVEISLPSFTNLNLSKCTFLYLSVAEVTNDRVLSALVVSDPDKFLEKTNGAQVDMAKYFTYQNKILQQADKEFWNTLVSSSSFFSSSAPDLYEFADFVPYDKHRRYTDIIDFQSELISWYNIISQIIRYELITSYMYEPYFFFREKLEQTLDEFRLVCFARQRAALLED